MGCLENERIKEAREQLKKITSDKVLMNQIIAEEMYERDQNAAINRAKEEGLARGARLGRVEGEKLGRAEGEKIGMSKMVQKLKVKNMSIDEIAEITGLTKDEIEKLWKFYTGGQNCSQVWLKTINGKIK